MTIAPVLGRALIEAVGCLLYESRLVAKAWAVMKIQPEPNQPGEVRSALSDQLYYFQLGTRNPKHKHHEKLQATNVYTCVDKLAKVEGAHRARDWYDELSDAAHPALGVPGRCSDSNLRSEERGRGRLVPVSRGIGGRGRDRKTLTPSRGR